MTSTADLVRADRLATLTRWRAERDRLEQLQTDHPTWAAAAAKQARKLDVLIRNAESALRIFP